MEYTMQQLKQQHILFYNQHKEDLQEGLWFFIDGHKDNQSLNHLKHKVPCYEAEIPKYLKQKESNISKSNRKSKHKHHYEECLIQYPFSFAGKIHTITYLHSYCTICGKIGDKLKDSIVKDYIRSELHNRKTIYSVMSGTELYEKYHDKLPVFFVDDIFKEKYIDLEQNDNSNGE